MSERYSFSLTTFSPTGKLVQIEYALKAVAQGNTSVGIRVANGAVIATEKKAASILIDGATLEKVSKVCPGIGLVYSGMGPDARVLLNKSRKAAQQYYMVYREYPPINVIVKEIAAIMQEYTQSGGVRPFGVSLLVVGQEQGKPSLYQVDPSGSFFSWKATAIGANPGAKTFLEKRYTEEMDFDDAVHLAILTLKEGFEGQMDEHNIQVGVYKDSKFEILMPEQVKEYLANLQ